MSGSAHITDGDGMMSTAKLELPYPQFLGQVSGQNILEGKVMYCL